MADSAFEDDVAHTERALASAKMWGGLGSFFTLGLWTNQHGISRAEWHSRDARQDLDAIRALQSDVTKLHEFLDAAVVDHGVRIALCVFPDVALDGRQAYGPFWDSIRRTILDRDSYRCRNEDGTCDGPLQIHHIRPLSRGGTNDEKNLITLCRSHHGLQHPGNPNFRR